MRQRVPEKRIPVASYGESQVEFPNKAYWHCNVPLGSRQPGEITRTSLKIKRPGFG